MEYKISSIVELDRIRLKYGKETKVIYKSGELEYHFLILPRRRSKQLLVFSNGAVDIQKKRPPVFMRHSWKEDFNCSLVFLDDPTIHNLGLRIGWGQGTKNEYALEIYNEIIEVLTGKINVPDGQVYYYGSSAGGFMSMVLASMHKGSNAVVNNPQTSVKMYNAKASVPLLEKVYGSVENAYENYVYRVKVSEAFKAYENTPSIYYCQNRLCHSDMKRHYTPFLKQVNEIGLDLGQLKLLLYHDREAGHSPLGREETVRLIKNCMN